MGLLLLFWAACGPALAAAPVTVNITGLIGDPLDNVRSALVLPPGLVGEAGVDRPWLDRFFRQVPQRVRQALEPYGYFEAKVSVGLTEVSKDRYVIGVAVQPGEPVRVARVKVRLLGPGRGENKLLRLVDRFPLHPGDILRQDRYEAAKGALKAQAIDRGYLQADFIRHRLSVSRKDRLADIDLELQTGPLFYFGTPLIHGAPDYPDAFLKRYLAFQPGERFAYKKLGQTQLNYLDSDRFRDVLITPHVDLVAEQHVPVSIQLVPADRWRLRPGLGYGTDTGARASLRYQDVNIFHLGHELKLDASVAQKKQSVTASYLMPSPSVLENLTKLTASYDREKTDTYTSSTLSVEGERIHSLRQGMLGSVFLRLQQEDYRVGTVDQRSRLVIPGVRFSWQRFSDPVRPRSGFGLSLEGRGTHRALASDTTLLQLLGNASVLLPFPGRLSLIVRGQGGTTIQSDKLADIPATLRFFAGGDKSVRGYSYQSLGPRDASGKVVGGKHLAAGSLELERALGQNWGVATFYDVGNAFNNLQDLVWAESVGIGLRYYTVVGPIRVDLARRVGPYPSAYRLHLSMGFVW